MSRHRGLRIVIGMSNSTGRIKALIAAATLVACAAAPLGAHAQDGTACTFRVHVTLSPGASIREAVGTFTTRADGVYGDVASPLETGEISCTGTASGIGTMGFEGHNGTTPPGEDCAHGTGDGTFSFTIRGRGHKLTFSATRGAIVGAFVGAEHGSPITGAFVFIPDPGEDCVNVPLTSASVIGVLAGPMERHDHDSCQPGSGRKEAACKHGDHHQQ